MTTDTPHPAPKRLSAELLALAEAEEHHDLTLGALMERLEGRVYTLFLLLLSLPMCQPIPLPGLSTPFGVAIALLGLRFAFRQHPWLPKRFLSIKLTSKFFPAALRGGAKVLGTIERLLHPRMTSLFDYRATQFFAGMVICFCGFLLLLPLPVPGTNTLPALTVIFTAAAFSERDGYFLVAAGIAFVATLLFFGALAWGGVEAVSWLGHSV
ncbi:MAG: exopolysaccharide biosynthesis protein [Chthoniobacterales bacterium]|nr:exopolysaccharide biosynthesis protein [Chthoniobacterales bacterium]